MKPPLHDLSLRRVALCNASPDRVDEQFAAYVECVLTHRNANALDDVASARHIASAMFVPGLDADALREEITMYAGELEAPIEPSIARNKWRSIERLVEELGSR